MASLARILCLNLGTQTIGLAEFQRADGGLSLRQYRLSEILSDPAAEGARLPQTRLAIHELKEALKFKQGAPIFYTISGQNLFARFVKLPTIAEEKIEQIIGFEAQQNVPFPIDEVVWDYQLVSSSHGPKSGTNPQFDVVLVAIKADLLEDLNATVEGSGLRTAIVDAAPMALYNAFRYSYPDLTGCSLLIDLGARTTNLIFSEPGKIFSRSITIGGNAITQALAKEFGEPFGAAEMRKKEHGYIGLGSIYAADKDPDVARAAKVIRNTMTRLHSDISRSINFYRAQQGGRSPQRIFLCGGTANLPYMREFFSEKFHLDIEFFNPLRNVAVASRVPLERAGQEAHQLGELVGLALRGVSHCPMELNLRPASVVRAQKLRSRRPFLAVAALCFLLALAGWWLYLARTAAVKEQVLGDKEYPAPGSLYAQVRGLQDFEKKNNVIKTELAALTTRAAPLTGAIDERQFWVNLLGELNTRLPRQFVWITLLEPMSGGKPLEFGDAARSIAPSLAPANIATTAEPTPVARPAIDTLHIKGLYLTNPNKDNVVVDFVKELARSPLFDVDLKNINTTLISRTPPDNKAWAYEYELHLRLKPKARLAL